MKMDIGTENHLEKVTYPNLKGIFAILYILFCNLIWDWIWYSILGTVYTITHEDALTINVPLFKKLRDIIFFGGENHFMSHFEGHFEGAKTFLTP